MRVAVIGGGIAGLGPLMSLEKARTAGAEMSNTPYSRALDRLGGSIASETINGIVLERGPDSFLSEKPAGGRIVSRAGLADQLAPSNDANRRTYIVVKNRLIPLPDGLMFLIPNKAGANGTHQPLQSGNEDQDGAGIAPSAKAERPGRIRCSAGGEALRP